MVEFVSFVRHSTKLILRCLRSEDAKSIVDSLTGTRLYMLSFRELKPAPETKRRR